MAAGSFAVVVRLSSQTLNSVRASPDKRLVMTIVRLGMTSEGLVMTGDGLNVAIATRQTGEPATALTLSAATC